jgi:hypothetical protein
MKSSRRDFLRNASLSLAALSLAGTHTVAAEPKQKNKAASDALLVSALSR